jgi:hypothetical protein
MSKKIQEANYALAIKYCSGNRSELCYVGIGTIVAPNMITIKLRHIRLSDQSSYIFCGEHFSGVKTAKCAHHAK